MKRLTLLFLAVLILGTGCSSSDSLVEDMFEAAVIHRNFPDTPSSKKWFFCVANEMVDAGASEASLREETLLMEGDSQYTFTKAEEERQLSFMENCVEQLSDQEKSYFPLRVSLNISPGMEPTLMSGSVVSINIHSYESQQIARGDIVYFENPESGNSEISFLLKRVVALSGETLEANNGQIFINGNLLNEPYLTLQNSSGAFRSPPRCSDDESAPSRCSLANNHVFVMGDNRPNSKDSRIFGPIPTESVLGRAFPIGWPFGGLVRHTWH
jgi:signal peptidase I